MRSEYDKYFGRFNFRKKKPSGYREKIPYKTRIIVKDIYNNRCAYCYSTGKLQIHHLDRDPSNNVISNLILLCPECHSEQHPAQKRKMLRWAWYEQPD